MTLANGRSGGAGDDNPGVVHRKKTDDASQCVRERHDEKTRHSSQRPDPAFHEVGLEVGIPDLLHDLQIAIVQQATK